MKKLVLLFALLFTTAAFAQDPLSIVYIGKTDAHTTWDRLGFVETLLPGDRQTPGDVNFCRDPANMAQTRPTARTTLVGPLTPHLYAPTRRSLEPVLGTLVPRTLVLVYGMTARPAPDAPPAGR